MMTPLLFQFFAAGCNANATFFGIPPWYKYLIIGGRMETNSDPVNGIVSCDFKDGIQWAGGDFPLIAMGILDICIRISALVAVGFIIYGGISYITSEGSPDQTKNAQTTIVNALIGLVIAIIATPVVSYIGQRIG